MWCLQLCFNSCRWKKELFWTWIRIACASLRQSLTEVKCLVTATEWVVWKIISAMSPGQLGGISVSPMEPRCYAAGAVHRKIVLGFPATWGCLMLTPWKTAWTGPKCPCASAFSAQCPCSYLQGTEKWQIHDSCGSLVVKQHHTKFQEVTNSFILRGFTHGAAALCSVPGPSLERLKRLPSSCSAHCMSWCCGHVTVCSRCQTTLIDKAAGWNLDRWVFSYCGVLSAWIFQLQFSFNVVFNLAAQLRGGSFCFPKNRVLTNWLSSENKCFWQCPLQEVPLVLSSFLPFIKCF